MGNKFGLYLLISLLIHAVIVVNYSSYPLKENIKVDNKSNGLPIKITIKPTDRLYDKSRASSSNQGSKVKTKSHGYGKGVKKVSLSDLSVLPNDFDEKDSPNMMSSGFSQNESSSFDSSVNSKEQVYYSYFSRIKIKLDNVWQLRVRDEIQRLIDSGRFTFSNKITRILIILNDKGQLENAQIITPSGYYQLDDTAVNSFRLAEPFQNPPKGLIESDGKVRVTWSFIIHE